MVNFIRSEEDSDHYTNLYFSEDKKWAVIENTSGQMYLYHVDSVDNDIYLWTDLIFTTWEELETYVESDLYKVQQWTMN